MRQLSGDLPSGLTTGPLGMTWDGQQLVIVDSTGDEIWTLARNGDETYTPGNAAVVWRFLPSGLSTPTGMTWDGQQLVIVDDTGDEIWTLARNGDETYTPGNATRSGDSCPLAFPLQLGVTWDGQQLVIADNTRAMRYGH